MKITVWEKATSVRFLLFSAILLWICAIIYLGMTPAAFIDLERGCESVSNSLRSMKTKLNAQSEEIEQLAKKIARLQNGEIEDSPAGKPPGEIASIQTASHEQLRRRAIHYTREIFYTTLSLTDELKKNTRLKQLKQQLDDISLHLEVDLDGLGRVSGAAESQITGLDRLSRLLNARIHSLQNPADCSKARYLSVSTSRPCGFGCNAHHLMYCFQLAYATGRILIFSTSGGNFQSWWTSNFLPLTNCNSSRNGGGDWSPDQERKGVRYLTCPAISNLSPQPDFWPPAIPSDLEPELSMLHGAPFVWFIGHFAAYLMRPTANTSAWFKDLLAELRPANTTTQTWYPLVGIHVRRTDKINTEAQYHDLSEYMFHAERFFKKMDIYHQMASRKHEWMDDKFASLQFTFEKISPKGVVKPLRRRVFLASDDATLIEYARRNYPAYEFIGDSKRASNANPSLRTTDEGIRGVVADILLLAQVDYIVCTFSSQVCRVSYELMQTRHQELGDASELAHSLDDGYYFGGQQGAPYEILISDTPTHTGSFGYGGRVKMAGNHWNGEAMIESVNGEFHRQLAPAYRFRPVVITADMGSKNDVP